MVKFLKRQQFQQIEWKIAVKTGIAATMSLLLGINVATLMGRPDSFISGTWSVLSTFIVLQAHLGGTYRAAAVRLGGVFIGCLLGGLFATLFGKGPLILGFSVFLTIVICMFLNMKDSIRIACLSVAVVIILFGIKPHMSPWAFSIYRFIDSTIGIFVAVVVTHALWPQEATQKMRFNIARTLHALSTLFRLQLHHTKEGKGNIRRVSRDIAKLLKENRAFLEASRLEMLTRSANIEDWRTIVDYLESIYEGIFRLGHFQTADLEKILDKELAEKLSELIDKTDVAFQQISKLFEERKSNTVLAELRHSIDQLNEELKRFRTTRRTREFSLRDVESYFVFFYHLRGIVEDLLKMESKTQELNATSQIQ